MYLTIDLIAESMEPFGGKLLLAQKQPFPMKRLEMLCSAEQTVLSEDTLYVCESKTLSKLPKSSLKNHCFVFRADVSEMDRYDGTLNAIVFGEPFALSEVVNHLLRLFEHVNTLEYQMKVAAQISGDYTDMMAAVRNAFPNYVMLVIDSAYNIITATHDSAPQNEYVDRLLKQKYYDKKLFQRMTELGYFDSRDLYLLPRLLYLPDTCNCPVMVKAFSMNGTFYAYVLSYCVEGFPTHIDQFLFQLFCEQLDSFFRDSGYYGDSMSKRQQMLDDLLSKETKNSSFVQDRCNSLGIPRYAYFRLGYVETDNVPGVNSHQLVRQLQMLTNVPNYGVFQYKSSVVVLFRDWHYYTITDQLNYKENWNELLGLLKSNYARIGISQLFTDMAKLRSAFDQAQVALHLGQRLEHSSIEFHYAKYFVYDLLEHYREKFDLNELYVSYLDSLNEPNVSNNNLVLLYHYITNERNITLTAKNVHMHRNSVIYRLQKIKRDLQLDLDDPDTRLRLMISFKILELEGKLPRQEIAYSGHHSEEDFAEKKGYFSE